LLNLEFQVKFKQGRTGFMKKFEGCWKIEPIYVDNPVSFSQNVPRTLTEYEKCTNGEGRVGSAVSLEQLVQPAMVPPPPISWYLRGITTKTTEMLIQDLLAETARLREARDDGRGGTIDDGLAGSIGDGSTNCRDDGLAGSIGDGSTNCRHGNCRGIAACGGNDIKERWRWRRRNRRNRIRFM
jgi:Domain of unknown function DUF220